MFYQKPFNSVVALGIALLAQLNTAAAGTTWQMYQADSRHSGYSNQALNPAAFKLRWRMKVSDSPLNPPVVDASRVIVSEHVCLRNCNGTVDLFAVSEKAGTVLWTRSFPENDVVLYPPSASAGKIYLQLDVRRDGADPNYPSGLYAFDSYTGADVFRRTDVTSYGAYASPTPYGDQLFLHVPGIASMNRLTGKAGWNFPNIIASDPNTTPAVDANSVYAYPVWGGAPGELQIFSRTSGKKSITIADRNFDPYAMSSNMAPVLGGANDVLAVHDGRLVHFNLTSKKIDWEISSDFRGQPLVRSKVIYVANGNSFEARDQTTGALKWKWLPTGIDEQILDLQVVTDTFVLVRTNRGLCAIHLSTKKSVWNYPVTGTVALTANSLYIATESGEILAIDTGRMIS